jgi:hypothetical protein
MSNIDNNYDFKLQLGMYHFTITSPMAYIKPYFKLNLFIYLIKGRTKMDLSRNIKKKKKKNAN